MQRSTNVPHRYICRGEIQAIRCHRVTRSCHLNSGLDRKCILVISSRWALSWLSELWSVFVLLNFVVWIQHTGSDQWNYDNQFRNPFTQISCTIACQVHCKTVSRIKSHFRRKIHFTQWLRQENSNRPVTKYQPHSSVSWSAWLPNTSLTSTIYAWKSWWIKGNQQCAGYQEVLHQRWIWAIHHAQAPKNTSERIHPSIKY